MSFNPNNNWLIVQSYKHDGSLHRMWERNYLVEDNDEFFIVASKKTKVIEENGRRWWTKEPSVTFYSKTYWWNTIAMFKEEGISFYTNIASPSIMHKGIIKYIDYDLDIKKFPSGDILLLDEKEYVAHIKKYGYSEDLITVLIDQTKKVLNQMKKGLPPFSDEYVRKYYSIFSAEVKR